MNDRDGCSWFLFTVPGVIVAAVWQFVTWPIRKILDLFDTD